ncbi:glycerophosphodiester phosphodiesterase [Arthrobacter glacialis]|uniref:glycerophosphodiester phosphodiesterase n=1 Tax=Arthrobacter glacialis TaxID=1664 RepID=UPI000CD4829C|nr:hypothetical protein [Arthrobacter glacialis]POH56773.1 hypothetical protein CVS28_19280 [Arthrobacter glacialis]
MAGEPGPITDTPVLELDLGQLRTVLLDSGQPTLTFSEVVDATSVELHVEIKDPGAVATLAELVLSRPADAAGIRFTSFQTEALSLRRQHALSVPGGLIVSRYADTQQHEGGLDGILEAVGASTFYSGFEGLTSQEVERLHQAGYEVHVWPLRSLSDVEQAVS